MSERDSIGEKFSEQLESKVPHCMVAAIPATHITNASTRPFTPKLVSYNKAKHTPARKKSSRRRWSLCLPNHHECQTSALQPCVHGYTDTARAELDAEHSRHCGETLS
jgi:hypothetical protein